MRSSKVAAVLVGATAALRVPWWIRGTRLEQLFRGSVGGRRRSGNVGLATRASRLALRVLARLPLGPWRNTCLYRSVAECLVLRAHAMPFRLLVGVKRGGAANASIVAHAWVDGVEGSPMNDLAPLASPGERGVP